LTGGDRPRVAGKDPVLARASIFGFPKRADWAYTSGLGRKRQPVAPVINLNAETQLWIPMTL